MKHHRLHDSIWQLLITTYHLMSIGVLTPVTESLYSLGTSNYLLHEAYLLLFICLFVYLSFVYLSVCHSVHPKFVF